VTAAVDTRAVIRIVVYGTPGPQGSKTFKGRNRRTGKAILVESSTKVKPWRKAVEAAALLALNDLPRDVRRTFPLDGPIAGRFVFTLRKPTSAPKRRRTWPTTYPDTSKLLRSTEDALTKAGVWVDDARLVEFDRLAKVYPGEDPEALDQPGVVIELRRVGDGLELPDA
jgi:Holliday junction resolvase RusA-like endonuclease